MIGMLLITLNSEAQERTDPKKNFLPAFPGAEGFGAIAAGGRGGKVLHVTNLNSKGPGSLQWACSQKGPRIIVFDVSGVIVPPDENTSKGKRWLAVKQGDVTIAGQTAPGAGITIKGTLSLQRPDRSASEPGPGKGDQVRNVIIRFLRVRPMIKRSANVRGLELRCSERAIFDHISSAWAGDTVVGIGGHDDVTIQWNAVEECDIQLEGGDEPHNFGVHAYPRHGGDSATTYHHNLIANCSGRTPCLERCHPVDWRNNVVYNACRRGEINPVMEGCVNVIGNYSKPGPGSLMSVRIQHVYHTINWSGNVMPFRKRGKYFLSGDYSDKCGGYTEPWQSLGSRYDKRISKQVFDMPPVKTHTAEEAYELVCAHAGCLSRDAVSKRTVAEIETFTGDWGVHVPGGGLMEGLASGESPTDADKDGMPDEWEKAHKLDPNDPNDNNRIVPAGVSPRDRHKGYTYIEYYINELADLKVARALTEYRLRTDPPREWDKPADGLNLANTPYKTTDEMVAAIKAQTEDKGYRTTPGWRAVQQLSRMGEKAKPAVPGLIKILKENDLPRTVSFASWALGAIGPAARDAVPALIEVLNKKYKNPKKYFKPFRVHGFTAWALGRIGPEASEAVPALAKTLLSDESPQARTAAAYALSNMGPAAKGAMKELLGNLGGRSTMRYHASRALANIGKDAVPALISKLDSSDKEQLCAAAQALRFIGPDAADAVPKLINLLKKDDKIIKIRVCQALAAISPDSDNTIKAIAGNLTDKEYCVRHQAILALGRCGRSAASAVSALETVLKDEKNEVKRIAALTLGKIGKAVLPVLSKAMSEEDPYVRKYAARALSEIGKDAVPALIKALGDTDAEIRREAVWSLGRTGKDAAGAIEALSKLVEKDADHIVPVAAEEVIRRIR